MRVLPRRCQSTFDLVCDGSDHSTETETSSGLLVLPLSMFYPILIPSQISIFHNSQHVSSSSSGILAPNHHNLVSRLHLFSCCRHLPTNKQPTHSTSWPTLASPISGKTSCFQQESPASPKKKSQLDGIYTDESNAHREHQPHAVNPALILILHHLCPPKSNTGTPTSKPSHRPQPSSPLEPKHFSRRYNTGVRALQSLPLPRWISRKCGERQCRLGGRYNASARDQGGVS